MVNTYLGHMPRSGWLIKNFRGLLSKKGVAEQQMRHKSQEQEKAIESPNFRDETKSHTHLIKTVMDKYMTNQNMIP